MGIITFCRSKSLRGSIIHLPLLLVVSLLATLAAFSQTKPERQSKAAKAAESTPSKTATSDDQSSSQPSNPEDKLFKGMKYRLDRPISRWPLLDGSPAFPAIPPLTISAPPAAASGNQPTAANTWSPIFDKDGAPPSAVSRSLCPTPMSFMSGPAKPAFAATSRKAMASGSPLTPESPGRTSACKDSRAIGKVIVNPRQSRHSFCRRARSSLWSEYRARRFPHSTDGGKTWDKVLYKDENTGGIDVAFDPHNPQYCFRRAVADAPHSLDALTSGGPGSGLYRSTDGGTTWKHLEEHGLPNGPYGRIGVAVAANSDRVYAHYRSEKPDGGLYRSDDGGDSWDLVNGDHALCNGRGTTCMSLPIRKIRTRVYIVDVEFFKSTDGGHTFNKIKVPHGDNHGLWIDPKNTQPHDRLRRWRRDHQPSMAANLDPRGQSAHRAVLPRDHRQRDPLLRLRRAAG